MKITVLRNVGLVDLKKLGASDRDELTEGNVVDVDKALAEALIERGMATTEIKEVKAVPAVAEVKGVK